MDDAGEIEDPAGGGKQFPPFLYLVWGFFQGSHLRDISVLTGIAVQHCSNQRVQAQPPDRKAAKIPRARCQARRHRHEDADPPWIPIPTGDVPRLLFRHGLLQL